MKSYVHRPEQAAEEDSIVCNLTDKFYTELPGQEYVAVYYDEEDDPMVYRST